MMITCALYARVSDQKQVEQDLSIPAQLKDMRAYAKKQGWVIIKEYLDEGVSGRNASSRPAFQEMIADAKARKFQKIICHKIDRFARNREDSVVYKSLLRRNGVDTVFVTEGLDDSIYGKLIEGILEVFAEFYSMNLSAEVKKGQKEIASRGFSTGGQPPYGYRKTTITDDSGKQRIKWEPDPFESIVLQRIFKEYGEGKGYKKIVELLNGEKIKTRAGRAWSQSTIRSLITNPVYIGWKIYNRQNKRKGMPSFNDSEEWIINKNAHEPLISMEQWEQVHNLREGLRTQTYGLSQHFLLSGLMKCKVCGSSIVGRVLTNSGGRKYPRYYCGGHQRRQNCVAKSMAARELESSVREAVKKKFRSVKLSDIIIEFEKNSQQNESRLKALRTQYRETEKKYESLMDKIEGGWDDKMMYSRAMKRSEEMHTLAAEIVKTESEMSNEKNQNFDILGEYIRFLPQIIDKMNEKELKLLYSGIIEQINIDIQKNQGCIRYRIPIHPDLTNIGIMPEVGQSPCVCFSQYFTPIKRQLKSNS